MRASRHYKFISDRDPMVYRLRTLIADEGLSKKLNEVAILSNRAVSTIRNLMDGTTFRPLNATAQAIITGLGYEMEIVKKRDFNLDEEIEIARAWNKKQDNKKAA